MMDNEYTLEKAAALLGVKPETLQKKIDLGLIDAHDEEGKKIIGRDEIIKLYGNIADDDENPESAKVLERVPAGSRRTKKKITGDIPKGAFVVEDEEAIKLTQDRDVIHDRILSMMDHIERLNYKIGQYNAIEKGKNAEFWKRIGALHPDKIHYKSSYAAELRDGKLVISPFKDDQSEDRFPKKIQILIAKIKEANMPGPLKDLMIKTIKNGTLPPKEIIQGVGLDPNDYYDDDE